MPAVESLTNEELLSDLLIWHSMIGLGGGNDVSEARFAELIQEVRDRMSRRGKRSWVSSSYI